MMEWQRFFRSKTGLNVLLIVLGLLTLLGFLSYSPGVVLTDNITVRIDERYANHFVSEKQVKEMVRRISQADSVNYGTGGVNLRALEKALMLNNFVQEAQASRDHEGNLVVDIIQDRPILRVMSAGGRNGYVSKDYRVLPLSENFSARVIVFTGWGADSLLSVNFLKTKQGQEIIRFVEYLNDSEFWRAQIAQIDLNLRLEMTLYPQVSKQRVEFGSAENFERKLQKLFLFYKEIAPRKGWNTYNVVSVKYQNQIVCR